MSCTSRNADAPPVRVGVISLGEAGNLGDDLLLIAMIHAIAESGVVDEVAYLSHGDGLDWENLARRLNLSVALLPRSPGRDLPVTRRESRLFEDCEAVVLGGGGLLQDVHHPVRPYHWLRYVPPHVPALAAGLGAGPLGERWDRVLATTGMPVDTCYVRDDDSAKLLHGRFGWEVERAADFVDGVLVGQLVGSKGGATSTSRALGVAVRAWPGLDARELSAHVDEVARRLGLEEVRLFALEARGGEGPDVDFTREVAARLDLPCSLNVYSPVRVVEFIDAMVECSAAVSMKLHSSALWSHAGVPVYPIIYAPKTAALFGLPYRGLEVRNEESAMAPEWLARPRSHDVVKDWLISRPQAMRRRSFSGAATLRFQFESALVVARRRAAQLVRSRS